MNCKSCGKPKETDVTGRLCRPCAYALEHGRSRGGYLGKPVASSESGAVMLERKDGRMYLRDVNGVIRKLTEVDRKDVP